MKLLSLFLFILISLTSLQSGFSQESPEAQLYDEFGNICSEEFMARYDRYIASLYNDPNSMGYVLFYGDETVEGSNLNFIKGIKNYTNFRRFDPARIVVVRGANQAELKTQFWIVPAGANLPKPEKEFAAKEISKTTRFDKNWADFYKQYDGKWAIYSDNFYDLGCSFAPNMSVFSEILLSNPDLTGYLVFYTEFGKGAKRANQVAAFAVRDLMKNYKVPRSRLKTIYGGSREEPEIELWFIPKGDKPPVPTPDSKPKK